MKKIHQYILIQALLAGNVCFAQTPKIKTAPNQVVVDGSAAEWASFVYDVDKKAKVDYLITKDDSNIYLVLKTTDPVRMSSILGAGVTWAINIDGKKSEQYKMTFPAVEKKNKDNQEEYFNLVPEQVIGKIALMKQRLINIKGFNDIKDNELSTLNPYGIKVAIDYNENEGLSYEAAIPLSLFKESKSASKDWAFNIKINGLRKLVRPTAYIVSSRSNSTAGNPGQQSAQLPPSSNPAEQTGDIQLTPAVDFWSKLSVFN